MVWQSAAVGSFDGSVNIYKKLEQPRKFTREEEEFELISAIRADEKFELSNGTKIIQGTYVDEYIIDNSQLKFDGSTFYVQTGRAKIPKLGTFVLTSNGIVYTNSLENRETCFRILSRLLNDSDKFIRNVTFDIGALDRAYPNQWLGHFYGRTGEVDSGKLYAKNGHMKDDKDFGKPYANSNKNEIGIFTKVGSNKLKVKVTNRGSVTIMEEVRADLMIQYLQDELLPFMDPQPAKLKS